MFILREFVGESSISLDEYWSFSCSFSSGEFSSEDGNSVESVLVFFELLDEELVGLTSSDIELDEFGSNGNESLFDPF